MQDRPTAFNTVSDSTLQLTFKKLVKFWCHIKKQFTQFEEAVKICFPLLLNKHKAGFSLYILTKTTYYTRLNAQAGMRIQLLLSQTLKQFAKM